MEQYSSGLRGAPAKGIDWETGAGVQISPAPPLANVVEHTTLYAGYGCLILQIDLDQNWIHPVLFFFDKTSANGVKIDRNKNARKPKQLEKSGFMGLILISP